MAMAAPFGFFVCLLIALPNILAISSPYYEPASFQFCESPCFTEVTMHLYLHQFVAGPNQPNRNEEYLQTPTAFPFGFGTTLVHDWTLTGTTNAKDTIVARAQGVHVQAGLTKDNRWYTTHNIVFDQGSSFPGSTLQVMGLTANEDQGQWSIVGGTGLFTMAQGTIKFRTDKVSSTWEDAVKELDIRVRYTRDFAETAQDAAGLSEN